MLDGVTKVFIDTYEGLENICLPAWEYQTAQAQAMFCCTAWQSSPVEIQEKYPQYEMEGDKFLIVVGEYLQAVEDRGYLSLEYYFENVLDRLVNISEHFDGSWDDPEVSGLVLERASIVGCIIGFDSSIINIKNIPTIALGASIGDVESQIQYLKNNSNWKRHGTSPEDKFLKYMQGDKTELQLYFHELLCKSARRMKRLKLRLGETGPAIPSVWDLGGNDEDYLIDFDVVRTDYHLNMSLLRCVEGPGGHA